MLPKCQRGRRLAASFVAVLLLLPLGGCDLLEEAPLEELPPLERPAATARFGLPAVQGDWHFAGWSLPAASMADTIPVTAATLPQLAAPALLQIHTQRLDSLAALYAPGAEAIAMFGEVRRDSVVSLASMQPAPGGSFIAGYVRGDTLWVELSSLPVAQGWPAGTRAAYLQGEQPPPFFRYPDGRVLREPPPPLPDTIPEQAPGDAPPVRTTPSAADTSPAPRAIPPDRPTDIGGEPMQRPTPLQPDTAATPRPDSVPPSSPDSAREPPPRDILPPVPGR